MRYVTKSEGTSRAGPSLKRWVCSILCLVGLAMPSTVPADDAESAMRILVDKTLMASNGGVMTDAHVGEIAAAGFTALSPRRGNDDPVEVERIARLAQKHGLAHLPWMRGTLLVPEDEPRDSGKRLVWADGTRQDLYSPNADELWEWLTERIVGYVRISADAPALMLTHDTAWFMDSPVPEVAVRTVPTQRVEAGRHVVETDLQVVLAHPALDGLQEETRFATEFRDHMIFRAGRQGCVLIENLFGDPVYVVGRHGDGRIAFSGSYYGFTRDLAWMERQAFLGCLQWLGEQ